MKTTKVEVTYRREPRSYDYHETLRNGRSKFRQRDWQKHWNEFKGATRVYVWPKGETILENLQERRNRPYNLYRPLVEKELREAGYEGKVRWDRHAGCKMCPCSPGFVLESNLDYANPVDVHITVTE